MNRIRIVTVLAITIAAPQSWAETPDERLNRLERRLGELSPFSALKIGGRIEFDYNQFDGAYNAGADGKTGSEWFNRRIRVYVASEHGKWDHNTMVEFSDADAQIVLARVRYTMDSGQKIKLGKIREDISLQAVTSSKHVTLPERSSLADMFSPYFRWGVSTYQYLESTGLRYAIGVYKNDAHGASGKDANNKTTLATTGRLTWTNAADSNLIHAGGWYSYRDMGGNELSAALARGEVRETEVRLVDYTAGGAPVALDRMTQQGLELAWQRDSLVVQGEYATRTLKAEDSGHPLDGADYKSYYIQASWFPGGEKKRYLTDTGFFIKPDGVNRAWELAVRYSDTDASAANQGTEVTTAALGVNYYVNPKVKIMFAAVRSEVDGPGADTLVGEHTDGTGFSARFQYLF